MIMKRSSFIITIICIILIVGCKANSKMEILEMKKSGDPTMLGVDNAEEVTDISLKYDIFNEQNKVGTAQYDIIPTPEGYEMVVEKEFSAEYLTGLQDGLKNYRLYKMNNNYTTTSYEERELIDEREHINITQKFEYNENYTEVVTKTINKTTKGSLSDTTRIILPPNENIFIKESNIFLLLFLQNIQKDSYIFYQDASGYTPYFQIVETGEIESEFFGKRKAYKVVSDFPVKTEYWLDYENNHILQKSEYLDEEGILIWKLVK
ncbi:hypothetical protein [Paenibacillus residui]|uniref:DUF4362 domain-containing protein n=1 Tax=Paenibacillus residui TaxID=629724 RepID=A0ABW3D8X3_9BACL